MSAAQACSGHFLPKSSLGSTALRECTRRKRDNIVLIDVDSEDFGDVIILDVPESFRQKFGKKTKHVISIDDDDDDDSGIRSADSDLNGNATTSSENRDQIGNATTSKRSPHSCISIDDDDDSGHKSEDCDRNVNVTTRSEDLDQNGNVTTRSEGGDQNGNAATSKRSLHSSSNCAVADDNPIKKESMPVNLSKPKRTYSGSTISRNRYGLSDFESCSSDSDCSDCEFMGESLGSLHGKWDKASLARGHGDTSKSDCPLRHCSSSITKELKPSGDPQTSGDFTKELVSDCNSPLQEGNVKELNEVPNEDYSANIIREPSQSDTEKLGTGQPHNPTNNNSYLGHVIGDCSAKVFSDNGIIVLDRQKLKETNEYKRAMEEEEAARQQQLKQQAEEAQRLRHRKKAENLRIMANEKRQLERLAEIRETRRKDEENLNLKDQFRADTRKQLRRLELMCGDMSSLLRCLGIPVGGGLNPSPAEVQSAYRQACLKFHPDRFAGQDLRKQVEAEEKFKLISNMKDKFHL